ncbi:DUF2798 domain-containing protein [Rhodobacteraceae bacterium]|nr:DUF2798 domain-containing protein [Paracoccaceae bacterium]
MFPNRAAPVLFALILTCCMTFFVSAVATWHVIGFQPGYLVAWSGAWLISWPVAFPVALFVAPLAHKLVAKMVRDA